MQEIRGKKERGQAPPMNNDQAHGQGGLVREAEVVRAGAGEVVGAGAGEAAAVARGGRKQEEEQQQQLGKGPVEGVRYTSHMGRPDQ